MLGRIDVKVAGFTVYSKEIGFKSVDRAIKNFTDNIEKIKSAQSELMTSAQKIGQALYAQQGAADAAGAAGAAGAGAAGSASNGSDDDVVDAEVVDDDDKDNK